MTDKSPIFKRSEENMTFLLAVKRFGMCIKSFTPQTWIGNVKEPKPRMLVARTTFNSVHAKDHAERNLR